METSRVDQRLRQFMLLLAGSVFLVTPVELLLAEHFQSPAQFIPFALSLLGLVLVVMALRNPQRGLLQALRAVMLLEIVGGAFGALLHFNENREFFLEIQPNAAFSEALLKTLTGAAPLLAPGILGLAGLLVLAALYQHPAWTKK